MMSQNRRGFITLLALAMLLIVVLVIGAALNYLSSDLHRAQRAEAQMQLRQLLLAGALDARNHAGNWGQSAAQEQWSIELPAGLKQTGGKLQVSVKPDATARILADWEGVHAEQKLRFEHESGHWRAVGAELQ